LLTTALIDRLIEENKDDSKQDGQIMKRRKKTRLKATDYKVVSLNGALEPHVARLRRALSKGLVALGDRARDNFYEVRMEDGCFYIHVYDLKKTVYLIAASQAGRVAEFAKQGCTPCNFQITAAPAIS